MSGSSPRSIAVVVVHGVADQQPHDSARAIAALLSSRNEGERRYTTFTEDDIRIDVEAPLQAGPRTAARAEDPLGRESARAPVTPPAPQPPAPQPRGDEGTFYWRTRELARQKAGGGRESRKVPGAPSTPAASGVDCEREPGMVLMLSQLEGYRPSRSDSVYRTVRLSSEKIEGDARTPVHVYEMYWADLSRLGQGAFRILGELYQLLLHVPSLGRHAVDAAAIDDGAENAAWQRLVERQRWAAYLLTVPIPILNLWILACVAVGLSGVLLDGLGPQLQAVPVTLAVALGSMLGLSSWLSKRPDLAFKLWAVVPLAILAACGGIYWALTRFHFSFHATAVLAMLIAFGGGYWLLTQYRRTQPHSWKFGIRSLVAAVIGLVIALLFAKATAGGMVTAALHTVEVITLVVFVIWGGLFVMQVLAWHSGRRAVKAVKQDDTLDPDARGARLDRLTRAERTARLTLGVPIVIFVVVTMMMWAGLYQVLERMTPSDIYHPLLLQGFVACGTATLPCTHAAAAWALIVLTSPELVLLLVLVGLSIVLAMWATLPVVISEVRVPAQTANPVFLGVWLDRGMRLLSVAGTLLIVASFLVVPLALLIYLMRLPVGTQDITALVSAYSAGFLKFIGTLIAGTAVSLLAFSGRLKKVTGGIRPVLDVMLDVDNYLREHPLENNPRARIFARYIAVLRHVCNWRDAEGRPYDAVVIMSHSQGTVITVDLLRFLRCYPEPALACLGSQSMPVRLLTMGSPLRQLYGLRFPHFYQWARHGFAAVKNGSGGAGHGTSASLVIPNDQLPDPALANLESWTNIYRSADYIGRHLWRPDEEPGAMRLVDLTATPPLHVSVDERGLRKEYCVGSGAHTRYWDGTAPPVAFALDELIHANKTNAGGPPAA
jgi:hypothetical protein